MMLPILISLSVTPGSYFFCAAAGFAANRPSASDASRMPRFAAMPTSPDAAGFPPIQRQSRVRPSGLSSFGWRRGDFRRRAMTRFTLYGSPHSLPTYKVALMLRMSGEPFSFRYVSFQKGMHKTPEFLALSRWGQVPVLLDGGHIHVQSSAIVEHLAEALGRFQGHDADVRQAVREWLC